MLPQGTFKAKAKFRLLPPSTGAISARRRLITSNLVLVHSSRSNTRYHSSGTGAGKRRAILGIRREDPQRIWERRCPLTPREVKKLVEESAGGVEVLVQPCERRVFGNAEFVEAGAKMHPTLEPADIIIGIKETPLAEVLTNPAPTKHMKPRTHIMFSHTHKGQEYNAPLLSKFLAEEGIGGPSPSPSPRSELLPTLIDWELLTDENGKRTVGFGWFAGVAGAIEGLVSTALLHLQLGVASPFLAAPRPHTAPLDSLLESLRTIGGTIARNATPPSMGPFIVVVTGSGQVSAGALHLLRQTLPIKFITVDDLPRLVRDPNTPLNTIYLLHATQETYIFNKTTGERATREAYYANPENFESRFHELIAPYMTLLINGVGWTTDSPRLMTVGQTAAALVRVHELQQELQSAERGIATDGIVQRDVMKGRCQSFADVSCDIEGGLGFLTRHSTLSDPYFSIDLRPSFPHASLPALVPLPPLQMMSVDILPTALPREASEHFARDILPYVRAVARRYADLKAAIPPERTEGMIGEKGEEEEETKLEKALERATVAEGGKLRERHQWLQGMVDGYRSSLAPASTSTLGSKQGEEKEELMSTSEASTVQQGPGGKLPAKKRVLLLGSGMVAGPTVEEICRRKDVELVVASDQAARNAFLCQRHTNATPVTVDISQRDNVEELIRKADVVISLLPVPLHPAVAELCVKHQRHLVTASYISAAMRALHERAVKANVLLLNEIGLDPGIDHCSALSLLSSLRGKGKRIVSFTSFCGGLPAPECADVPLKYKFSWSPKGVLSAALNGARFLVGGKTWSIPSENLLKSSIPSLPASEVLQLEGLPNRDSLSYSETYGLRAADGLQTLFRGTIRYPGFSELIWCFKQLGLLDTQRSLRIDSYTDLTRASIEDLTTSKIDSPASMAAALRDLAPTTSLSELLEAIQWLSQGNDTLRPPKHATPVIDLFATLLAHKLAYKPGERDLVVLHHEITTGTPTSPNADVLKRDEVHTSALEVYGTLEHSAMALCVGLPVALAALRVLDGGYREVGVQGPNKPDMYEFVLQGMEERGLGMKHRVRKFVEGRNVEGRLMEIWN